MKFPKNVIESFAKYYALQIEMNWITIDKVPDQFKERTQYYVDLANQEQELVDLSHAGLQEDGAE